MRSPSLFAIAALVCPACLHLGGCDRLRAEKPRDVVVLLIDTQRPDYLGFGGYHRENAPFLAQLARHSLVATRAYSTSTWTPPATASLFTSLYAEQHGVIDGFVPKQLLRMPRLGSNFANRIPDVLPTLPEVFRDAGYRTFGLSANLLIGEQLGFERGFDHFVPSPPRFPPSTDRTSQPADSLFARLDQWKDELAENGPNLIYLHFMDVHWPYGQHAPWFHDSSKGEEGRISAYNSETSRLDLLLKRAFRRYGWGDAIVVVLSDHGEAFRDHGTIGHEGFYPEELARVLMMFYDPRRPGPHLVSENTSLIDVLPTLAELAGIPWQEQWEGTSLVPAWSEGAGQAELRSLLRERTLFARRDVHGSWPGRLWAAVEGDWKLVDRRGKQTLHDLARDPRETRDVAEEHPAVVQRLAEARADLEARSRAAPRDSVDVRLDPARIEELRALGYVQ